MKLPSFSAESSLYFSKSCFRSRGGGVGVVSSIVLPQDCSGDCALTYGLCLLGSGGNPLADIACYIAFVICEGNCPGPGGGGPPPPPECCPPGLHCCGDCVVLPNGGEVCRNGKCARSCP